MKVLVTGATGFVGKVLVQKLQQNGDKVVVLTRNIAKAAIILGRDCDYYQWADSNSLPPVEAFENVDGIVNLMGENIGAKRWSDEVKSRIYHSRIDGTKKLAECISQLGARPRVLVSSSAIGIYGSWGEEEITENSSLGDDFLATVCKDWEKEAVNAEKFGLRVVLIRTGIVLGRGGGALQQMLPIFKLGLGGPLGNGHQYMSWIQIEDLCSMYIEALHRDSISGAFDGTAPYPVTNKEFTRTLSKVLKRPAIFPAPAFAIKKLFGEMSTLILDGQKVLPTKFKEVKFRYRYPTLDMALKETAF